MSIKKRQVGSRQRQVAFFTFQLDIVPIKSVPTLDVLGAL